MGIRSGLEACRVSHKKIQAYIKNLRLQACNAGEDNKCRKLRDAEIKFDVIFDMIMEIEPILNEFGIGGDE